MKLDKEKKDVAPKEPGDRPNEKRCSKCWALLSKVELDNKLYDWCIQCQRIYKER